MSDVPQDPKSRIFKLLRGFYGWEGGASGLQPDLLGERLIANALGVDDELIDIALAPDSSLAPDRSSDIARHALTVLTRLARQAPHEAQWLSRAIERHLSTRAVDALMVAMETGSPMPEVIASALQRANKQTQRKVIDRLLAELPEDTVNLADLAVDVAQLHIVLLPKGNKKCPTPQMYHAAYSQLASRCDSKGQFKEAIAARQKALQYALLVSKNSKVPNHPILGSSHNDLSVAYRKVCDFSKALNSALKGERIYRSLAKHQPDAYWGNWATSLNNLANPLRDLGQYDDALANAQQAEQIRRELAQAQPDAHQEAYANSMGNLAEAFLKSGQTDRSLSLTSRAIELYEVLKTRYPDKYTDQQGWCRRLRAESLLENNASNQALLDARQAEAAWQTIYHNRPDYAAREYGKTLEVLARCQHATEGLTAAMDTLRTVV